MSALPETVDAWRMVASRRTFEGSIPLRELPRLRESLASDEGSVRFEIEFGRDELQVAYIGLKLEGELPLVCQRTLEPYGEKVALDERLGLIAKEEEEAALPPGYEPLLTETGELKLADVIEDELILALPVVPMKPGLEEKDTVFTAAPPDGAGNPFAALASLKKK